MHDERLLRRLYSQLVHTDLDRDIYQDTFLWMERHPCSSTLYESRFRNRFKWLRVEAWQKGREAPSVSPDNIAEEEKETLTTTNETKQQIVNNLRNAIHKETYRSGRKKKPRT